MVEGSEEKKGKKGVFLKRFLQWLEDPYNKIFLGILFLGSILRIWVFLKTYNQPVWWDAADYLSQAKALAGKFSFQYSFNPRRPFFLALLWGLLLKLGFGEISIRVTEVIFSIVSIFAIYLAGKEIFNKKVGLISSFLWAVFWQHLFFTGRPMTEIPAITFFVFAIYFFWAGYVEKKKGNLVWFGVFLGLSLLTRGGMLMLLPSFLIFLFVTDRWKFLKNRELYLAGMIAFLILSTFFIFIYFQNDVNPFSKYLGLGEGRFSEKAAMKWKGFLVYFSFFPNYLGYVLLFPFLIGLLIFLFKLFLGVDLILKKPSSLRKEIFVFSWILVPFIFLSYFVDHMEPRYLMVIFPALFFILSVGILKIYDWMKPYGKNLAIFVVILFLLLGGYYQIKQGMKIIDLKSTSYLPVKQAGEWIKANSKPSDKVVSASFTQTVYYSERKAMEFGNSEEEFDKKIQKEKPRYMVVSVFEAHPKWAYTYPQKHKGLLKLVKVYSQGDKPLLVIYEFEWGNFTNSDSLSMGPD